MVEEDIKEGNEGAPATGSPSPVDEGRDEIVGPDDEGAEVPVEDAVEKAVETPVEVPAEAPAQDPAEGHAEEAVAEATEAPNVTRSAAMMSVLVVVSRITGFLRTWGQAYALGVTALASCYTVANNMPNQLYELVMGGMIMTAFLPVYLSVKKKAGREGANAYASNLLSIVVLLMGVLTVLSFVFAGPIIWTQSFSASAEFDANLSVYLFRFFVVEVILYALSSIISGILNAERDYLWSNAAPIFNNVVCTASFLAFAALNDSNPGLALLCLAIGNPLGVLVQVVMQIPSLRRHNVRITPRIDLKDPALRDTLAIGVPTLIVTIISFPTVAVQTSCALQVTATGASVAYYSRLWYTLPYAVFAVPVTVAYFTELSSYMAEGDMASFKRCVTAGTNRIVFMLVPFALFLIVFAPYLITILAAGRFDAQGLDDTILYLRWLALALPFYGLNTYLQKICSSLRKMNFFTIATLVAAVVQIGFCFLTTDALGLAGVAGSSTLFFAASDLVLYLYLRRELGALGLKSMLRGFVLSLLFGVIGSLVAAGVLYGASYVLGPWNGTVVQSALLCVLAGIPAVLATYGLSYVFGVPEAKEFVGGLLRRGR